MITLQTKMDGFSDDVRIIDDQKPPVDYDKLYHAVMDTALSSTDKDTIFDLMDSSVVDAVPVIRCRECENWKPTGSRAARNIEDPLEQLGGCEIMCIVRLESDFCSCGKRKVGKNG